MHNKLTISAPLGPSIFVGAVALSVQAAFGQSAPLRFDAVRVVGNEQMSDQEVLDLCGVGTRKVFDDVALQGLVSCLGNSGKFKDVSLGTEGRDLLVEVSELPNYTGFLDISASLDTERGASVRLEVQDTNLFDRGVGAGIVLDVAREEQNASATLANPNFLGRSWRAGVTLSYDNLNYDDQSFSYREAAFAAFLGVPFGEQKDLTIQAGFQADEMYDVALTASPILQAEAGKRKAPFVSIDYDAVFLPSRTGTSRFDFQASQIFSGVGQNYFFSKTRISAGAAAAAIPDRLNLSVILEGGHIQSSGGEGPRAVDRFQLGGESLRGFAPRGIGPTDGGEQLGGTSYAVVSLETSSPLWSVGATQIEGGFFADIGSVWGLEDRAGFVDPVDDGRDVRSSIGVSLTANIGSVPVTMYYAKPLQNAPTDRLQAFGLSLSSKF